MDSQVSYLGHLASLLTVGAVGDIAVPAKELSESSPAPLAKGAPLVLSSATSHLKVFRENSKPATLGQSRLRVFVSLCNNLQIGSAREWT